MCPPQAQALLRGRAWVAQLWVKSVGAVGLRALPLYHYPYPIVSLRYSERWIALARQRASSVEPRYLVAAAFISLFEDF